MESNVYIKDKDYSVYVSSCLLVMRKNDGLVKMMARGSYVKPALDVLAILLRDYVDDSDYSCDVKSEKFNEKWVTALEINLKGKIRKKDGDKR